MDDFFSDNQGGSSNESNRWSEKAWLDYIRRSEAEIERIADIYERKRREGVGFEEVASIAGWPIAYSNAEILSSDMPEYSKEPLTLINHPIYIVSRAIIAVLERSMGELVAASNANPAQVWNVSKSIHQASSLIILAINSTDLGEDMLAHSIYKSAISCLNTALASIESLDGFDDSNRLKSIRTKAISAVFDLRQICLNLS